MEWGSEREKGRKHSLYRSRNHWRTLWNLLETQYPQEDNAPPPWTCIFLERMDSGGLIKSHIQRMTSFGTRKYALKLYQLWEAQAGHHSILRNAFFLHFAHCLFHHSLKIHTLKLLGIRNWVNCYILNVKQNKHYYVLMGIERGFKRTWASYWMVDCLQK